MVVTNGKSYHFSSYPVNHALWAYTKADPSGVGFLLEDVTSSLQDKALHLSTVGHPS
jgi:hypothetical protein